MPNYSINIEKLLEEEGVKGICIVPVDAYDKVQRYAELMRIMAVTPVQTHSLKVIEVNSGEQIAEEGDAIVTFRRGITIGIKTADCVPILVYSPDTGGIAAIHAGWRGTLGGIVDNVMDVFEQKGADLSLLKVAFGPSIRKDAYEVDRELADKFAEKGFGEFVSYPKGEKYKPHIDLQGINMERMKRRGVSACNIRPHMGCTFDSILPDGFPRYISYRRNAGQESRMLTCIKML